VSLRVRFAEVNRSALRQFSLDASAGNVDRLGQRRRVDVENAIGEILRVGVFNEWPTWTWCCAPSRPTRRADPGRATCWRGRAGSVVLAGGEFPYTVVTPSAGAALYSVQFKEFGVRLKFLPVVSGTGNSRSRWRRESVRSGIFGTSGQVAASCCPRAHARAPGDGGGSCERGADAWPSPGCAHSTLSRTCDTIPVCVLLGDLPSPGALFRSTLPCQTAAS
jgi:hypothetical protein